MFQKTNRKDRSTYKIRYFCEETNREQIYVLRPGENGVTELDIRLLHQMDDNEVDNNIKNHRPNVKAEQKAQIAAWCEEYIAKFAAQYGYEPHPTDVKAAAAERFPRNWCYSIDALMDGDGEDDGPGDASSILASVAFNPYEDEPKHISRLHDIVAEMPEAWQDIYAQVIVGGMTNTAYARLHGKTEGAVRKTVSKIQKRIAEDELLKKLFLRGTK